MRVFAQGTFLLPGDDALTADTTHTNRTFEHVAWDAVFARHASSGALLLTVHNRDRVLLQRKLPDSENLQSLGSM